MLPQHRCNMLVENERLKKMVRKLKKDKDSLKLELSAIRDEQKMTSILKQFVTTRNMEVQTDPTRAVYKPMMNRPVTAPSKKPDKNLDTEKLNKMMILHNNLMKRYEKELHVNMEHLETITTLNLRVNDLQQKLVALESKAEQEKQQRESGKRPKGKTSSREKELEMELAQTKKTCDKITKETKKLKQELRGLDPGFFEEVEDIKFALQQSAKLNKEYEKCLKQMCKQFGMPYPHPERAISGRT